MAVWELFVAALAALAGYALGTLILVRCRRLTLDGVARRIIFRTTAGAGALAYLVFALGLLGWLVAAVCWPLTLAAIALAVPAWRREASARRRLGERTAQTEVRFTRDEQWPHLWPGDAGPWAARLGAAALAWIAVWSLLRALAPPTAYDDLTYHLAAPSIYAATGRVSILPWDHHTAFPFTFEMLSTLCLVLARTPGFTHEYPPLHGGQAAQLVHLAAALVALLAVWQLGRDLFGPRAGWLAAVVWAAAPVVAVQFGTCYTEPGYALCQVAGWLALVEYLNLRCTTVTLSGKGPRPKERQPQWLPVLGLCAGLCVAVKLTGVLAAGYLVAAVVVLGWRDGIGRRAVRADALVTVLVATVVAAPWIARTWIATGNPVFPFAQAVFQSPFWSDDRAAGYDRAQKDFGQRFEVRPTGELVLLDADPDAHRCLARLPGALYRMTMHPEWYYDRGNNFDGKAQLGPAYAALLPVAAVLWLALCLRRRGEAAPARYEELRDETVQVVRRPEFEQPVAVPTTHGIAERVTIDPLRPVSLLLGHLMLMMGFWFASMQYSRYLVPHFALWAILAAWAAEGLLRLRIAAAAVILVVTMQAAGGLAFVQRDRGVLPGIAAEEYAARRTPLYGTMRAAGARPGVGRVALYGEPRGYYLAAPYFWAERGHSTMIPDSARQSAGGYLDFLTGSLGVTHAVIAPSVSLERTSGTDDGALLGAALAAGRLVPTEVPYLYEVH